MTDTTKDAECLLPWEQEKREVIVRKQAKSDPAHGCDPLKRSVPRLIETGIINLNKPAGPSSHQVSAYVQEILGIDKAGHSGTLDPNVTGCLPVALAKSTRITDALLKSGKEYVCYMRLHADCEEQKIRAVMDEFRGKITQLPPVRSAVKRAWRERSVYYLKIIEIDGRDVLFAVGCQAGTYIRKLVHDIGLKLGCGANMQQLIRTKAGPFNYKTMWTMQDLRDAMWYYTEEKNETFIRKIILPVEEAVAHIAKVWVFDTTIESLCHGATLGAPGIASLQSGIEKGDIVAVMSLKGELVGIAECYMPSEEMQKAEKGLACAMKKVFMEPGTYPRMKKAE